MPRKNKYDKLVDDVRASIQAMAPENCTTIEEAFANAERLAARGLCGAVTQADYVYCKGCGRPTWHGQCAVCSEEKGNDG